MGTAVTVSFPSQLASFIFASFLALHVRTGEGNGGKENEISEIGQVVVFLNFV